MYHSVPNIANIEIDDLHECKKMMLQTKAFLTKDKTVKSNRGQQYTNFIKPTYEKYKLKGRISEAVRRLSDFAAFQKRQREQSEQ